ncbi:WG repeat-containing protein [Rufibacter sp. H-1]|uniref:WG repeat-containing protein n=1 Tax=Rufibacter sediminis TaxID=2762756 RepID=A0ABR6VN85_9BACT|nr:WG repeat-containing protein [Rufibacter sediminis]MBC3538615.1 WG repeat-containing protein [Rufibacter sediminis]
MKSYLYLLLCLIASCKVSPSGEEDLPMRPIGQIKETVYIYEENGKEGLHDSVGNIILPAQFDYIQDWQEYGFILVDSGGRKEYNDYKFNKYGLINATGKVLFRPQFDYVLVNDYSSLVLKDSLYGYVDTTGNWLIKPKFKHAVPFYRGTAVVEGKGKYFLIDKKEKLVSTIPFDTVWGFKNGVSVVVKDNQYAFVDYKGKLISTFSQNGISEFNWYHGQIMKDGKWYVVDTTGQIKIKNGFESLSIEHKEGKIYAEGVMGGKKVRIEL